VSVAQLPHWDTIPAFSRRVGFSEWLIREEIKAGRLRARRVGRCLRILDEDGAEWMRGRGEGS
jgi:hypothetical protein